MSSAIHPRLSHCGIYVKDVGRQVEFYTRVLGLVVSDRGVSGRLGNELAFLTAASDHHHQVVFISGRAPQDATTVNQLSFKVDSLEELKAMYDRVRGAGVSDIRQVNHGNALSFYLTDPEEKGIEVYMDTPWYVPQPHGVSIDLSLSNGKNMEEAERLMDAKSIAMTDTTMPNGSGILTQTIFKNSGVMDAIKPKIKVVGLDPGQQQIAKGEIEIGFFNISEIRPFVKYGGPVPAPLQQYTNYDAAVTAKATAPDDAATLVKMIASIPAQEHWKSAGMEPVH